jgi:DNA polymerase-4
MFGEVHRGAGRHLQRLQRATIRTGRMIFLLDIDCFFASVEMALHPELRGKPVCVGGRRGERGIVSCPNYEARAWGVRTAMPLRTAERLLPPEAVFLRGNHRQYGEYSDRVMAILESFTPDVEQVSVDEAYLDVTGCLHFWPGPEAMGAAMKERIRRACDLTVSIGIASNRLCAKIAAGLKKPDGLLMVAPGTEREFLLPLPVEAVPGVGKKTQPRLNARGIRTVADLLDSRWGRESSLGRYLMEVMEGRHASRPGRDRHERIEHSISRDTTFAEDVSDRATVTATLYYLAERCCKALRKRKELAATVTVKVRFPDFTTVQKQVTLRSPSAQEEEIFGSSRALLAQLLPPGRRCRLVGVKVSHLAPEEGTQMELGILPPDRRGALHRRLDELQEKHGYGSIHWGITHALRRWR